jgi:hypothetical protein
MRNNAVSDEFDLSASDNLMAPSGPILFPPRSSEIRDVIDLSASDNMIVPSLPRPVLSEDMK